MSDGLADMPTESANFALEDVLHRSSQFRSGGAEALSGGCAPGPSCSGSKRRFLALSREKLNGRVFLGRPFAADFAQSLDMHGRPIVMGKGMSGDVYQARRRADGRLCAVKSFEKSRLDEVKTRMMQTEAQIFLEVDHPNIVRLLACHEDEDSVHFAMECCHGGELDALLAERGRFSEEDAADVVRQMLWALLYLHDNSIVHRDLKLENWLIEEVDGPTRVKLIDFGLSCTWDWDQGRLLTRSCGTTCYMAPEVVERRKYTHKADLWSLGVIVSSLLSGRRPQRAESTFGGGLTYECFGASIAELSGECHTPEFCEAWPDDVSSAARDFVERLLAPDPDERMDARQALGHPWLLQHCGRPGGGAYRRQKADNTYPSLIEGWRRFAELSPVMRALLVEFAFASRWPEGSMRPAVELWAELSEHQATVRLVDFEHRLKQSIGSEAAARLFSTIASSRRSVESLAPEQIGYSEFLAACLPGCFTNDHLVSEVFRMLDTDNDGLIARAELLAVAAPASTAFAESQRRAGNDLLCLSEFARLMSGLQR